MQQETQGLLRALVESQTRTQETISSLVKSTDSYVGRTATRFAR
jgi:hypothetical protein